MAGKTDKNFAVDFLMVSAAPGPAAPLIVL